MKSKIYELYYEDEKGTIVYCNGFGSLEDVTVERNALEIEFPEHEYWYEVIYADEQ